MVNIKLIRLVNMLTCCLRTSLLMTGFISVSKSVCCSPLSNIISESWAGFLSTVLSFCDLQRLQLWQRHLLPAVQTELQRADEMEGPSAQHGGSVSTGSHRRPEQPIGLRLNQSGQSELSRARFALDQTSEPWAESKLVSPLKKPIKYWSVAMKGC